MTHRRMCDSFCALLLLAMVGAPALAANGLSSELDVQYGKGGDAPLKLDLFRPVQQDGRVPGVLVIHGGAWRSGLKEHMRHFAEQIARAGYVTASVQYRLCPKHQFPAQIEDVKCAVRWMRANADKYQIDAEHIGAMGMSAGGHLALMLGTMDPADGLEGSGGNAGYPSKIQAVVNYFGPVDFTLSDWDPRDDRLLVDFLGGKIAAKRQAYVQASPVTYLDPHDAPVITFHGTMDPIVPYGQAILLDHVLREKKVPSRMEPMVGAGHGWFGTELIHTQKLAIEFLDKHLKPAQAARK